MNKISSISVLLVGILAACAGLQIKTDPGQVTVKVNATFKDWDDNVIPCDQVGMQLDVFTDYGAYLGTTPTIQCAGNELEGFLTLPAGRYYIGASLDTYEFGWQPLEIIGITGQNFHLTFEGSFQRQADGSGESQRSYQRQTK